MGHDRNGYLAFWEGDKHIYEHRRVMEQHIGRTLTPNENVHHINGDRKDNRIENLVIVPVAEHSEQHWIEKKPQLSIDKEWMQEQYCVRNRTIQDMSNEIGISHTTMRRKLRESSITLRPVVKFPQLNSEGWLRSVYPKYTALEIGHMIGSTRESSVTKALRRLGIERCRKRRSANYLTMRA